MSTFKGLLRGLLLVLSGFLALSAIPGGVALIAGINAPPAEMLKGSPFSSFIVPGACLLALVGGSAALSTVLMLKRHRFAVPAAISAGLIVMVFEFVEILAIGSPPGPPRVMQILYFALGAAMVSISVVSEVITTEGR